jgi:hypothetical protein
VALVLEASEDTRRREHVRRYCADLAEAEGRSFDRLSVGVCDSAENGKSISACEIPGATVTPPLVRSETY